MSQIAPRLDDGDALVRALLSAGHGFTLLDAPSGRSRALAAWAFRREGAFFWDRGGDAIVAAGIAARLDANGEARFEIVRRAAVELALTLPPSALLVGGFAFAPEGARGRLWHGFADASFTLPRWTYRDDGRRAWIALARLPGDETPSALEATSLAAALFGDEPPASADPRVSGIDEESVVAWRERVGRALVEIRAGQLSKVVCARRATVGFEGIPDIATILDRLPSTAEVTRFAVRRGERIFFGATPERLLARSGTEVRTDALAGTARRGEGLLDSVKDRHEQRLVVDDIASRLAPLCAVVETPSEPRLRPAPGVTHLYSAISARTRGNVHLLTLAAALHPTPAVGGVPTTAAVEFVRAHEPARGWYAGGVGWFNPAGDGELAVGIRSGLLCRDQATLFVGAGIVRGSDARAELRETDWKLAPMLQALGAEERAGATSK